MEDEGGSAQPGVAGPLKQRGSTGKDNLMNEEGQKLVRRWHIVWELHEAPLRLVESSLGSLFMLSSALR